MRKKNYTFKLNPEVKKKAEKLAKEENRSLSNLIETLLMEKIKEKKL